MIARFDRSVARQGSLRHVAIVYGASFLNPSKYLKRTVAAAHV